jgi:hypothetical protein
VSVNAQTDHRYLGFSIRDLLMSGVSCTGRPSKMAGLRNNAMSAV